MTIRVANLPLYADEFSKEFTGYKVISLVDFFFNYNQLELDMESRNLIAFVILLGFL